MKLTYKKTLVCVKSDQVYRFFCKFFVLGLAVRCTTFSAALGRR